MGDFDGLSYGLPGLIMIAVIVFCYKTAIANQRSEIIDTTAASVIAPSAPPLSDDYIAISLSDDEPT